MSSTSEYQYQPLSDPSRTIRLLSILPPSDDGTLSLSLHEHPMASAADTYDALSYTWGPPSPTKRVLVDGAPMHVRENLWTFLHHCTTPSSGFAANRGRRALWIDAVCINQDDGAEKALQVQAMRTIFGEAYRVVVWLGEASAESCVLEHYCAATGQAARLREGGDGAVSWAGWSDFVRARRSSEAEGDRCLRADMARLVASLFWTRVWIVQEISLARRAAFVSGSHLVPIRLFHDIAHAGHEVGVDGLAGFKAMLIDKILTPRVGVKEKSLPELVVRFKMAECSVDLDRVYSMLGLVEGGEEFVVDYDISMEELFLRALRLTKIDTAGEKPEWDHYSSIDSLAGGMHVDPEDVVKHPSLQGEITKQVFSIPLRVKKVFEACCYESDPLTYVDGDFKTASCFTKHPCSNYCVSEGPVPGQPTRGPLPCKTCHRPVKANCLVEFWLPFSGWQYDFGSGEYEDGHRNNSLMLIFSETGMRKASKFEALEKGWHPRKGSFEISAFSPQVEKDLSPEVLRKQIDLTKRESYYIFVPVSFQTLIELRRHSRDGRGKETNLPPVYHLSEVDSASMESCDEIKEQNARDERSRLGRIAAQEAYERLNPMQKLIVRAREKAEDKIGEFLLGAISG